MADITPQEEMIVMALYVKVADRLAKAYEAKEGVLLTADEVHRLLAFHEVVAGMLMEKSDA